MKLQHILISILATAGLAAGCDNSATTEENLTPETTATLCSDGVDNDGNGLKDCDEDSCKDFDNCKGGETKTEICDNTLDDDGDDKIDCDDEDCASAPNCKSGSKEICDNNTDDDNDGKADCLDEDCASAANCKTQKEICNNNTDDDNDGKVDCLDEDCASDANCQGPKEICDNETDDDDDDKIDCEDEDCASAAACAPKELKNLKYKVGLVSDIHFDSKNKHNAEHEADLINAINYFKDNNVSFIANCGDIAEYEPEDYPAFQEVYTNYAYAPTGGELRLLTAIGNHDFLQLFSVQTDNPKQTGLLQWVMDTKAGFDVFTGETKGDLKYFEYDAAWDQQYTGAQYRTVISKLSYYLTKDDSIYIFLSLDYGHDLNKPEVYADARAWQLLDMDNKYVKQMKDYVADTSYDESKEKLFNYQFYHPNTLIWLKDIIENNTDKHIFVVTHHFITHKAGNGVPYSGKAYYSDRRIWPYSTDPDVQKVFYSGANSLSGLEFHFINKLNNKHKNVIWFSGHTHYLWEDAKYDSCLAFCNKEFDYVKPTGTEVTPLDKYDNLTDYKRYTRLNDKPKGLSAYNVHIPSLSKPTDMGTNESLYKASQGGLMEVYENGVRIKGISFKKENASNYENEVVVTKDIFFP